MPLSIIQGDITRQHVDAIVNAANSSLLGGGGVDRAIHRAAGPALREECRTLGGCPTGEARITRGYNLPAQWVIHTVGPVWQGGSHREDELLANCYRSCLALVEPNQIHSIAFPSISTGAYGFPIERASRIALREIDACLHPAASSVDVIVVCFGSADYQTYLAALDEVLGEGEPG